ncbi:MAG: flagellar export chaperone FliS [Firmicutes bacterium]|nr:flagellar export chaperone FliS [Bacillota bacterium]
MAVPQQYRKTSIETSSPEKLLLMLYGGAINFLNQALAGLEARDYERVNKMLTKSQAIIDELMASLNMEYEISQRLWPLYDYFLRRLVEANVKKEREPIEEVLGMMTDLQECWSQAVASLKTGEQRLERLNVEG